VLRIPRFLNADIRQYLESENDYTKACSATPRLWQKKLVAELARADQETIPGVPAPDGPVRIRAKISQGGQHEMFGRTPRDAAR